jgi:hypothetical protein
MLIDTGIKQNDPIECQKHENVKNQNPFEQLSEKIDQLVIILDRVFIILFLIDY